MATKQGKQDIIQDDDFGANAAMQAATNPASVKAMLGGGKGGTQPGIKMKHDQR